MTRRDLIRTFLSIAHSQPLSAVQMQRATFLAVYQIAGLIDEGPGFDFQPEDFGFVDRGIDGEIDELRKSGEAVVYAGGIGRWTSCALSDRGAEVARPVVERLDAALLRQFRRILDESAPSRPRRYGFSSRCLCGEC